MYILFYKNDYYFYFSLSTLYKDWAFKYNKLIFNKKHYKKDISILKIPFEEISTNFLLENFELCEDFFRKSDKKCLK